MMRVIRQLLILCGGVGLTTPLNAQALSQEQVLEGEKKFLKSREDMVEVHLRLTAESTNHKSPTLSRKYTQEIWATDGNLRLDSRFRFEIARDSNNGGMTLRADESGEWVRDVTIQHCEQRGQMFCGTDTPDIPKFLGPHQWQYSQVANLFHPNLIGCKCGTMSMYRTFALHMNICSADRRDLIITQVKLGDLPTCKLVWSSSRGVQISLWLDPAIGFYPVQIEARSQKNLSDVEARYSQLRISEISPARGNGTLYPRKLHYKQFLGTQLVDEETVTVDEIEIGPKIDPAIFTIAGTKLGSTFMIVKPDVQKSGQWTEDKFIPYSEFTKHRTEALVEMPPVPVDSLKSHTWLYALASGLIAVAAIWFVARMVAKRRSPS